jgi:hypothetical protein
MVCPSGTVGGNPVYSGSDEHFISNATLQNRVSQLGTDMVIARASTPPGRSRFEDTELSKTSN